MPTSINVLSLLFCFLLDLWCNYCVLPVFHNGEKNVQTVVNTMLYPER